MSDIVTLNGYKIKDEKAVRSYESIAQMKADTKLKEGYHVKTKGYYEVNDGGHGEYVIVDDDSLVDDGGLIHTLNNGLRAKLIIENDTVRVEQFGAYGDGTHDDTNAIEKAIKYTTKPHTVQFLAKTYAITNISLNYEYGNVILKGVNSHYRHFNFDYATKIVPYEDMTGTMFTIGEEEVGFNSMVFGFTVKDICFTGNIIDGYDYNCFEFGRSSNLLFENVIFRRINGYSMKLKGVYDSIFNNVEFMSNGDYTSEDGEYSLIITGGLTENNTTTSSNALRFDNCRWEGNAKDIKFDGNYNQLFFNGCKFEEQCSVSKVLITVGGEINFTNCVFTSSGTDYLIAFNNTQNRTLTKFLNCTFTAPTSGLIGGKWINVIASNANGIIIDGCSFDMPNFNGALNLGNYTKLFNSTFYSYSSDEITKVIECEYYCDIENLTLIFANNPKPVDGSVILLNHTGNIVRNIISSNTGTIDYTCIVKASSQDNILDSYSKRVESGSATIDARQSNVFSLAQDTTVTSISNSWNGCEITLYANGSGVSVDFTNIQLLYNYISSISIPAGRTITLRKINTTKWVLVASNT